MPRYFFHSEDGRPSRDDEGTELPSLASARVEAVRVLGDILKEAPHKVLDSGMFRVTVTDNTGLIYFCLDLSATDAAAGKVNRNGS